MTRAGEQHAAPHLLPDGEGLIFTSRRWQAGYRYQLRVAPTGQTDSSHNAGLAGSAPAFGWAMTGSPQTARIVSQRCGLKPRLFELGGNGPVASAGPAVTCPGAVATTETFVASTETLSSAELTRRASRRPTVTRAARVVERLFTTPHTLATAADLVTALPRH